MKKQIVKTILMLMMFLAVPKFASASIIFETNFDSNADWNTDGSKEGECSVPGQSNSMNVCDAGNYPAEWEAYRAASAFGGAHPPVSIGRPPGPLADHTGTSSGKTAIIYNESYPAYTVSGWPGDGILTKYFGAVGYQELYVQLWMRTQPGYQMVENGVMKFFRFGHWKGLNSSNQNIYYTPDQMPGLISEPCYHAGQWGYLTAYRCDPNDFYCTAQNNAYQKSDIQVAGGGNWGDGNWHRWGFHIKMNTIGGYDGIYEESMDGVTKVSHTDVMFRKIGSTAGGWNDIMLGGNSDNPYTTQSDEWYAVDDFVVSTAPIPADYIPGGTYVDTYPPTTTASPLGGTYTSTQSVSLTPDETATTKYCLGSGCTPTTTYSTPISIGSSTTLRFFSTDSASNIEITKEEVYTIDSGSFTAGVDSIQSINDDNAGAGNLIAQPITLSQTSTIKSISVYVNSAAGNIRLGIYSDSSGSPATLKASTADTVATNGWNTINVTQTSLTAGTYWLALATSNGASLIISENGSTGTMKFYNPFTYANLPATFPSASSTAGQISLYASLTTTPQGGDATPPAAPTGLSVM